MLDLLVAGEAFDDYVFYGLDRLPAYGQELKTDRFARSPGGGAVITSIAAARLGVRCAVVSGLSDNAARALRQSGVRVRNLRRDGEPPAITVALSTREDRAFVTFNGVNNRLPGRIRAALGGVRARHVHFAFFPRPCAPWIRVVEMLRRSGATTSWDFGWNPPLTRDPRFDALARSVDYLFLNRAEALLYARVRTLAGAMRRWRSAPRHVVIKLGARGSHAIGAGVDIRTPPVRVRAIDTTGAGDAFNAGFLAARIRGASLPAALRAANRIGAVSTTRPGGI